MQGVDPRTERSSAQRRIYAYHWYAWGLHEGVFENGLLLIGYVVLSSPRRGRIDIALDLGGCVEKGSVLMIRATLTLDTRSILANLEAFHDRWSVIASSFGKWQETIADSPETCGLPIGSEPNQV